MRLWDFNLKVRLVGEALFNMLFWMYFPFIAIYFSNTLGNQAAGLLMSIPPVVSMAGSLIGGSLADSLGRRPVMLAGAFLQALMFALFALSPSPWLDFIAYIGIGFGGAIYRPPSSAMVADLVPEKDRRQVFATFTTAKNFGAILGPAIGAILFFQYRKELLWTCTAVLLLYGMIIFLVVRETRPKMETELEKASIWLVFSQQVKDYKAILQNKVFALYIAAGVFSVVTIMQLDLYLAVYIVDFVPSQPLLKWSDGIYMLTSNEILGWILGWNGLLFVLFILPITKWLSNWKERDVFILSSILSGGGTFAVGLHSNIWYLFFVTVIFTFGEIIRSPVMESFISSYAPKEAIGKYMGADSLQYTLGRFIAPITVFLSDWVPSMLIFSLLLLLSLIGVLLYVHLFRMIQKG